MFEFHCFPAAIYPFQTFKTLKFFMDSFLEPLTKNEENKTTEC